MSPRCVELHEAAESGELYTHHFNMMRGVMEKTASFLGYGNLRVHQARGGRPGRDDLQAGDQPDEPRQLLVVRAEGDDGGEQGAISGRVLTTS